MPESVINKQTPFHAYNINNGGPLSRSIAVTFLMYLIAAGSQPHLLWWNVFVDGFQQIYTTWIKALSQYYTTNQSRLINISCMLILKNISAQNSK